LTWINARLLQRCKQALKGAEMRESVKYLRDGLLAKAAKLVLALSILVALGLNPVAMQRHMANANAIQQISASDTHLIAHEAPQTENAAYCVQMAPCIAIIDPSVEVRLVGTLVARLLPAPAPLADSRTLAPPFHPPIV